MSFSPKVKRRALIASARYCCVCHRYKGVGVEVHHIVPEDKGGSNDFDNAITLCFDCHCAAGHYNPEHPKGSKYSRAEMKDSRDKWYQIVEQNEIEVPKEEFELYCRYLICKDYKIALKINNEDFSKLPLDNIMLFKNDIFNDQSYLLGLNTQRFQVVQYHGGYYKNIEEYCKVYPDAIILTEEDENYPYYLSMRIPTKEELVKKLNKDDFLTKFLLDSDIPVDKFAKAFTFIDVCGEEQFAEAILIKRIWFVYFTITNSNDKPIKINSVQGYHYNTNYREIINFNYQNEGSSFTQELPEVSVPPNMTVILPIGTLLSPFEGIKENKQFEDQFVIKNGHEWGQISFVDKFQISNEKFDIWGKFIIPEKIQLTKSSNMNIQSVHELDLSNLYVIDRVWLMGSCPHLFFKIFNRLHFIKELFGLHADTIVNEEIYVPKEVTSIIIAELEDETTYIKKISSSHDTYIENMYLRKGEFIEVDNVTDTHISISGLFRLEKELPYHSNLIYQKNETIRNFYK